MFEKEGWSAVLVVDGPAKLGDLVLVNMQCSRWRWMVVMVEEWSRTSEEEYVGKLMPHFARGHAADDMTSCVDEYVSRVLGIQWLL